MKRKSSIILITISIIILIVGITILIKNSKILENDQKLEIIDATYICADAIETFYEDDYYIYSFPCIMSNSIYVKFENGNKMLITDALESKKVTIDELIDAGLKVIKEKK